MKIRILLTTLCCLVVLSCSTQKHDIFEEKICDCVDKSYDSININFDNEMLKFEEYLINTKQLESSDGKSYYKIFNKIALTGEVPFKRDFDLKISKRENIVLYSKCFYSQINNPEIKNANSKIKALYDGYSELTFSNDINPSSIAKVIIRVLDPSDFNKEIYKFFALNTFNQMSLFNSYLEKKTQKEIELVVTDNHEIIINGEFVEIDSIENKIRNLLSTYTIDEKKNYIVNLFVENNVKIGIVKQIKNELDKVSPKKINLLR